MATVDAIVEAQTYIPGLEVVRADLTGATSTYVSRKFARLHNVFVIAEGTNGATYTWTGITVTITGTNDDHVNILLFGEK